jgi:hypothetical protein
VEVTTGAPAIETVNLTEHEAAPEPNPVEPASP